ncbi:MAG: universal stress protein [Acidimicrobiia bacterium]|nr:universal stress protein [Acidimicrobiia bacterium]
MFDHVIVPIDGSEHAAMALGPAVGLARAFGATLVLLRALYPDDVDAAQEELRALALSSGADDTDVVLDTVNGPVGALTDAAGARPGALVCMTTHGRGGLGRALFGSVAEEALREVGGPFVLVGPNCDPAVAVPGTVVVPLDGSRRSESILPLVAEWARRFGVGIWIVSVVDPAEAERAVARGDDLAEDAYVQRVAGSMPGGLPSVDWDVLRSADPAQAITEFAASRGFSTIAVATHGRTGLARVAVGSVATRIVHDHAGLTLVVRTAEVDAS